MMPELRRILRFSLTGAVVTYIVAAFGYGLGKLVVWTFGL